MPLQAPPRSGTSWRPSCSGCAATMSAALTATCVSGSTTSSPIRAGSPIPIRLCGPGLPITGPCWSSCTGGERTMNLPWKKADSGNAKNKPRKPHLVFEISLGGAIVYVLIIVVLFLIIWSTQRERESHVRVPDFRSFEQALPSIANLTGAPILAGNSAEVLQNGDGFFPPLFDDIAQAKESIHFETYVWWKGEICDRLAHTLAAKARDGVEVRMTLDATGSNKGDDELFEEMEKAGVKISYYHPIRIQDIGLINNRTHRKVAVIDGKVAYVFGHGMAQEWTGNGQDEEHWRDTGVRLEGPIVNAVQGTFAENWVEMTAEVVAGDKYFPRLAAAGDVRAHVTATSPNGGVARLELLYKL